MIEKTRIRAYVLEYDDETHTYLIDGVIVPSVTQIIHEAFFKNMYDFVPPSVLEKAAERGTEVHSMIERYCKGDAILETARPVKDFNFLMRYYSLDVLQNEVPVIIEKDGEPKAAGRLDLVLNGANGRSIADIKTTATLNKEFLLYQLNLYRLGYMQSYETDIKELYGIHIRPDKRKLVDIPVNEDWAWHVIDAYERSKK